MLKDKLLGKGDKIYYLYHRKDLGRIVLLNFLRRGEDDVLFDNVVVTSYGDLADHLVESLDSLGVKAKPGSKNYITNVLKSLDKYFLSEYECANLLRYTLGVRNRTPAMIYGVLERSVGYGAAEDFGGLICLYGGSGSGKTTFLNAMTHEAVMNGVDLPVIVTSEPVARALPLHQGLAELLIHIIVVEGYKTIAFDSFRGIVYGSGGSTLSGGVSAAMLEITMNISRLASLCGKIVLGVINPLNVDEEKNATLVEALLGSTTGLVRFSKDNFDSVKFSHRYMASRELKEFKKEDLVSAFINSTLPDSGLVNTSSNTSTAILNISNEYSTRRIGSDVLEQFNALSFNNNVLPTVKF